MNQKPHPTPSREISTPATETAGPDQPSGFSDSRPLSQVFEDLAENAKGPISFGQIEQALSDRSFAAVLTFFALVNLLPLPPGTGILTGIPLVLISAQMVLGFETPWLPRFLRERSLTPERFRQLSQRGVPWLKRIERFIQPRMWPFARRHGDRWLGLLTLILGLAVVFPIPLSNWLPALATAIIGAALTERDGILMVIGILIGLISLGIIAAVLFTAGTLITKLPFL
ncbi:exopolysaccharide biosynthesis protein [Phyllobacterium salinisoli]|uniref:Exopolysaccharide biosynthesis protein n=1 Tax=Phyllobacterium salinisoli TaxID=1899321 RepID=A0A368K9H2_9HYPH|nr:exopolysaccharide biosynthesis protein [Phyllobacterium salinisoli]RCS25874.1 exopolysaccharide biosynthesis protein [Phyllobacterium salinisoli]